MRFIRQYLITLPILVPSSPSEVLIRDQIEGAVAELLDLKGRLSGSVGVSEAERLRDRVLYLEGRIDRWIYGLYGLGAEEIAVVEGV